MMRFERIQKFIGLLGLFAGVLAIANVDSIWQESRDRQEAHGLVRSGKGEWRPKPQSLVALNDPRKKPLQSALSRSLEQDELAGQNPFAHLSSFDPLQAIIHQGVVTFHREAFRSPTYHEESGYDMLSYEVAQADGSKSTILAYAEGDMPFVAFMVSNGPKYTYSFYRGGALIEQSDLTGAEAQAFVAQHLDGGVPFLSLSR